MNKGKILKITENTVYIGYEDGSLKEIPIESCEFEPRMGDYVEVYGDIAIKTALIFYTSSFKFNIFPSHYLFNPHPELIKIPIISLICNCLTF